MKHSTGIIYDAFKICGTIFKLDVRISIEVISHYQRVEIRYAGDSYKCSFEVDLNQPYKEFDDEVNSKNATSFQNARNKENKSLCEYDRPFFSSDRTARARIKY